MDMNAPDCLLCGQDQAIKRSHIIPAFVYRAIKSDSPSGYFRNPNRPNRRRQDGDKRPLLCRTCEQRFGDAERAFYNEIFKAFHATDRDRFDYGPWLHYFMTSMAWRTLILDLPSFRSNESVTKSLMGNLEETSNRIRRYLLGADSLASRINNHMFFYTAAESCPQKLASAGPNVLVRRSTFGYTLVQYTHGYATVINNLAGILCFLIIKGNLHDNWTRTKINPEGGSIVQPQMVSSWAMGDLSEFVIEMAENKKNRYSKAQRMKTLEAMKQNPDAPGLRFLDLDNQIIVND